jgi:hypothetical protein
MEVDMKKLIVAAVFAVFMVIGSSVFAQDSRTGQESEYYYKNISLEKIYPYRNGYVVQYRRGINTIDKAYLPMVWFTNSAGKGEIITLPQGKAWPSMSVYYKNGKFSHVRVYVHHLSTHQTWGVIPQNVDIDSAFETVDDLQIKF